jgi:hypothetical protein
MDFMSGLPTDAAVFNVILLTKVAEYDAGLFRHPESLKHWNVYEETVEALQQCKMMNGPEFRPCSYLNWCKKRIIEIKYTQPGKTWRRTIYEQRFVRYILDARLL